MVHKKMTSAQCQVHFLLSPIGKRPIEPEEADEELDADQVHKEWKEYTNVGKRKWKENTN
jgi:hypothetical protein